MNFRQDIQGLRGIAILGVFVYHLNPTWAPGGFVGVDIFFVISGYLITQILLKSQNADQPIITFYMRRIVRLFPAFFFMLVISTSCVYLLFFPKETINFSNSLISSVFYLSNIYFSANINYLTVDTHLLPLLHTWSLSAEAQCYLVYPFIFYFTIRQDFLNTAKALLGLLVLMFILNLLLTRYNSDIAFFSPTVRFYQFLAGAIIVFVPIHLASSKKLMGSCLIIGTLLILVSFYSITRFSDYPGVLSLLPTLGAMLVILSGAQDRLSLAIGLDNKLLVLIGAISYSLYLWHWPVIVFYKVSISPVLSSADYIWIILISLFLAITSWYLIENKLRHILATISIKKIFSQTSIATLILVLISSIFIFSDGFRNRYSKQQLFFVETDFSQKNATNRITDGCMIYKNWVQSFTEEKCIHIKPDKKNILLFGDSHAEHFRHALEDYSDELSVSVVTISACRPTLPALGRTACTKTIDRVYSELIKKHQFDMVLVSARWSTRSVEHMSDAIDQLAENIDRVVIIGPIITYASSLPNLLARHGTNLEKAKSLDKLRFYDQAIKIDKDFKQVIKNGTAEYVSLIKLICPNTACQTMTKSGTPLQWDNGHLTYEGAVELIDKMKLL